MKYLEIKDNKGYYLKGQELVEIDRINKEDILAILNHAENDDFDMDQYDEELLQNKAHQIIYESIYNKLTQFLENKDQFRRATTGLYNVAMREYSANVTTEDEEIDINEDEQESDEEVTVGDIPF